MVGITTTTTMRITTSLKGSFVLCYYLIGVAFGKGALESEETETELPDYEAEPRDPVPASEYYGLKSNKQGIYDTFYLDYYAESYSNYPSFIFSPEYYSMKADITNSTLVCVNFDVQVNGTYLGVFTCPLASADHEDFLSCCGERLAEFCCYDDGWLSNDVLYGALALFGILIGVILMGVMCYVCLGGKRKV